MSGNQKQAPSGAPQQQRYVTNPYTRIPTPQRPDAYQITTTPGFVTQQSSNQSSNQGPTIRGMAQTGPPTQASTPPQNDMSKMQPPQTAQIQIPYMPQQVRPQTATYFRQQPSANQGNPRMQNRQTMASTVQTTQPIYSPLIYPQINPYHLQYNTTRPPPPTAFFAGPSFTLPLGHNVYSSYTQPTQNQTYYFPPPPAQIAMTNRQTGPPPPVAPAPQGGGQPLQQPMTMQPPIPQTGRKKTRSNALPIINPQSGKDIFEEDEEPSTLSGDSSARETPQPQPPPTDLQVSAEFAARVAAKASEDKDTEPETNTIQTHLFTPNVQNQHHNANVHLHGSSNTNLTKENDVQYHNSTLVQNSKLQASTKEFIPDNKVHSSKDSTTPVVSANTVGVEVMLPNKSRDRESPMKMRRQQQQQQQQQHQQQHRESIPKETPIQEPIPKDVTATAVVSISAHENVDKTGKGPLASAISKTRPADNKDTNVVEHRPAAPQSNSVSVEDAACTIHTGKNKGANQKSKENTGNNNQAQQSTKPIMPVPGSQPSKASSKTNKMRELNNKGANKEGSEMDAFTTTETPTIENCTNDQTIVTKEEIIEKSITPQQPIPQQIIPQSQQQQSLVAQVLPQIQQQQQQQQQPAAAPQKLADVKTMPKPTVDVTSIVKEVPRTLKPPQTTQQQTQQQPTTDSQDETDRAACEKLVQVKNETNISKTNSAENTDSQVNDKTVIRYKKDQWSPLNTEGQKRYDRDFLLGIQSNPRCKKKPENLPDLDIILKDSNRSRMEPRSFPHRQSELLMPTFHKSSSQRGSVTKRGSQQGKASMKGPKQNTIHVTLSLREDIKLRETENAWRPARLSNNASLTEDEMKTAELYKKVRGVLNKLTPEKFDKLLSQVRALPIDNVQRLQGVIDLVFEKAVDEPNFSVAYALLCKELAMIEVPAHGKNRDNSEIVHFRKLLITRCQMEFEKNSVDENARNLKLKEIEECTDPEKKRELQFLLEEDDRRMRIKSVGNIRFIGELFKQEMLTTKIMIRCINILLENKDEDSLECLCKLLTTIGKDLEIDKNQDLSIFFHIMKDIVDRKHGKISSRVRFMLQDVMDLRNSKWIPRRQDLNPKTMEQIQKEADTEQLNIQVMNSAPINTPRKGDHIGSNVGSDRKRRNIPTDESGWSMATSRSRTQPYTVESSKLMNKPPPMEEMTLGSKNLFGKWGGGSNIKTQTHAPITNTTNMYAALENINAEQEKSRSFDTRMNKDPYLSKGHSMERYKQNYEDGRNSRSGSQQRSAAPSQPKPPVSTPPTSAQSPAPNKQQMSPKHFKLRIQNILDEYLNDCYNLQECELDIRTSIEPSKIQEFIREGFNSILERSKAMRIKAGLLFAHLVSSEIISNEDFLEALKDVLSQADDLVIDIPKLWDYLAEIILPLVTKNVVPLEKLAQCMELLKTQGHGSKLLAQLLKQLVEDIAPNNVVTLWQKSGVQFTDFLNPEENVENYIKEHNLSFLMGGAGTPIGQGSLSWDEVHDKLLQFLRNNASFDTITEWIQANVGERIRENQFIRTLVTAVVENDIMSVNNAKKLRVDFLKSHYPLLQRYVDNQEHSELQCIFALQALVNKWEHPQGLLLGIFERFWEDGILSNDSILAWERDNDPEEQQGKAIAVLSVQRLFTALKEVEDESSSSASEEA